jgi:hypothetical protein
VREELADRRRRVVHKYIVRTGRRSVRLSSRYDRGAIRGGLSTRSRRRDAGLPRRASSGSGRPVARDGAQAPRLAPHRALSPAATALCRNPPRRAGADRRFSPPPISACFSDLLGADGRTSNKTRRIKLDVSFNLVSAAQRSALSGKIRKKLSPVAGRRESTVAYSGGRRGDGRSSESRR